MMKKKLINDLIFAVAMVAAMLLVWSVVAALADAPAILPSVSEVIKEYCRIFSDGKQRTELLISVANTLLRAVLSFAISFAFALLLALAVNLWRIRRPIDFLVTFLRSLPTVSIIFIILCLLNLVFHSSEYVAYIVAYLVVFPVLYVSFDQAILSSGSLLQACDVFCVGKLRVARYVMLPSVAQVMFSQSKAALSLAVKVVISGEALSLPRSGLGTQMYTARVNYDMAALLARTLIALACCYLLEWVIELLRRLYVKLADAHYASGADESATPLDHKAVQSVVVREPKPIILSDVSVCYGERIVYKAFSHTFEAGKVHVVLGGSGCGKTTLLNVVANLVPFSGSCVCGKSSYVFQEPRLAAASVLSNVQMVLRDGEGGTASETAWKYLCEAEIASKATRLATTLSGGEQQRVALARAFAYPSDVLLLDEPFKSLDYKVRRRLFVTLDKLLTQCPRTTLFVTHDIDEALTLADYVYVASGSPVVLEQVAQITTPRDSRDLYSEELLSLRRTLEEKL